MKKTISLVLVLVLCIAVEIANADFTFGTPVPVPNVNSTSWEGHPSISTDELELFFMSDRPGGNGEDIWVATRETIDGDWRTPVWLGITVNSSSRERYPNISADGLSLYFTSLRPGGSGGEDLWVTTRKTISDPWEPPVNLGSTVNKSGDEWESCISTDGLTLYFTCGWSGGYGTFDLWITTRETKEDPWTPAENLGPTINSSSGEATPSISADGLMLFFSSSWPGTAYVYENYDLYVSMRPDTEANWGESENLGPMVNGAYADVCPSVSSDGRTLYFSSNRPDGPGEWNIWQAPIAPVVDLNDDGVVNGADLSIIADHWGTDDSLCDIGPMPWGDGVVDVQDLIVIAEYLSPAGPEEVNVNEENDGGQIELEQGQILVVTLESNPTTGYRWEQAENQEPILEQMGEAEFIPSDEGEPPIAGAGGWEIFRFKAISAGKMTLQLVYHRSWEEGVEPVKTFSLDVVIH